MDSEIELQCDLTDLDRNGALPISTLLVWAQKCRVGLYAKSPLVSQLRREVGSSEPTLEEETMTGRVELEVGLRASDEDTNRHVKHVRYCHFMEDCVEEAAGSRRQVSSASLTYLKECGKGETCRLVLDYGPTRGKFEMRNQANQVVCTAQLSFFS
ncbi:hypothetical protein BASA81_006218 [Batrachochytrium salamandrivorans]|nr:hypothetical protein BASA81_006218 [Batrachochytrium salamandrivorans]